MTTKNAPRLLSAFRFFRENAGYCVGQAALGAWSLTKAEQYARRNDWEFSWEEDFEPDLSWMDDEESAQYHEVYGCVCRDVDGNVLADLWGIVDPDSSYRRVVEAELALEAQFEVERVWGGSTHSIPAFA
jgi:hypothetical protein